MHNLSNFDIYYLFKVFTSIDFIGAKFKDDYTFRVDRVIKIKITRQTASGNFHIVLQDTYLMLDRRLDFIGKTFIRDTQ